jgi:glycine/D-amino acid oxidase-like deaminating enzyme/nitrite reductase/ring-hydroxylating ferredoxin subunit
MIARDGAYVTLWQEVPAYESERKATAKQVYDVIIVGGGITGITTALLLQKSGKNCLVLEAKNLCFGTSGGTTAHLNTLLDTPYTTISKNFGKDDAKLVAKAAAHALNLIRQNISDYTIQCDFEEATAYLFSANEKQDRELEEIYNATEEVGLAVRFSEKIPATMPFVRAIEVANQGKFHPVKYVHALAREFERLGGTIKQYCRVNNIHEESDRIKVDTETGTFRAKSLVYATHIPPGINLVHLRCSPYRSYAMAVKLNDNNYPDGLIYDMENPYYYYRSQIIDNQKYLIAGGKDHKTAQQENTENCLRLLEAHVRKYYDVAEVTYQWSSQYYEPVDGLPYIGHLPGHTENVYVATGFGGNGMTYSHVAAQLLHDAILNIDSAYKSLFSPSRIKPIAGFTDFIGHNTDVIKHFVGKWFTTEELNEAAELSPGEGKVVIFKGHLIALSKDSDHMLHAVSPACTHMKCSVAWNLAEQSWDCPCHGARYSPDGKVLNGPASKDLEYIELRSLTIKAR